MEEIMANKDNDNILLFHVKKLVSSSLFPLLCDIISSRLFMQRIPGKL
jgi:hypothetical protein